MSKSRILIADDDSSICNLIKVVLEKGGYNVTVAYDGLQAYNAVKNNDAFDLIILDIVMPTMFGTSAAKEIRKITDSPIIFLTARSTDADKVEAYGAGGDDYIVKPFSTVELMLRVNALLKRTSKQHDEIEYIDDEKSIKLNSKKVEFTERQYALLKFFRENKDKTLNVQTIYESVWHEKYMYSSNNIVMVNILALRKKIEEDYTNPKHLLTVWGKGYKYVEEE